MKRFFLFLLVLVCIVSCSLDENNCDAPTQLSAEVEDHESVKLTWDHPIALPIATDFEIQYGPSGFSLGDGTFVISGNKRETINNLIPNTSYDFYVRTLCRDGDISNWSQPMSFTTNAFNCSPPIVSGLSSITDTSFNFIWSNFNSATSWDIEYGLSGFTIGNGTSITTEQAEYTITDLLPGTAYDFYVRTHCEFDTTSAYSEISTWTTFETCAQPTSANHFFWPCSQVYSWSSNTETSWDLEYGLVGFTLGTGIQVTTNASSYQFPNLMYNTTYDVYIRANCGVDGLSDYYQDTITTSTNFYTGMYLIEEVTDIDPVKGPVLSNGSIVEVVETSDTQRQFQTENYPNLCPDNFMSFTFELECAADVRMIVNDQVGTCDCSGNYMFGIADNPETWSITDDDSEFFLSFTNDVSNDCGDGSNQVTYKFTQQ